MKPADPLSVDAYEVEHTLPHLLNRAGVAIGEAFGAVIAPLGLTIPDWRILSALVRTSGLTVSELAAKTSLEVSRVSRAVAAHTRKGYVKRGASERDGREVRLHITAAGRRIVEGAIPTAQLYERVALAGVSAEDAAALKATLERIYANIASLRPRPSRRRSTSGRKRKP